MTRKYLEAQIMKGIAGAECVCILELIENLRSKPIVNLFHSIQSIYDALSRLESRGQITMVHYPYTGYVYPNKTQN